MFVVVLPAVSFSVFVAHFFEVPYRYLSSDHPPQYGGIDPVKNGCDPVITVFTG
jgi:hypothetical protein